MNMILQNREYQVKNSSEVREILTNFKSVKEFDWINISSSAGDWQGYIIQKLNNRKYLIIFGCENNYPHSGFTLRTNPPLASWVGDLSEEEIYNIIEESV